MKLLSKKSVTAVAAVLSAGLLIAEPAMAADWAGKTNSVINDVITGLRVLGAGIATLCLIWSAYQIIWGGKRLQDMVPFFIGAGLFLAGPELVNLFFG